MGHTEETFKKILLHFKELAHLDAKRTNIFFLLLLENVYFITVILNS